MFNCMCNFNLLSRGKIERMKTTILTVVKKELKYNRKSVDPQGTNLSSNIELSDLGQVTELL